MTHHYNPTLDEICDELGIIIFSRWKAEANREWRASEYFSKGADAKHAFEYSYVLKKYNDFREMKRAK